ncbi:unknown; predicted coding region [Mycoplasmopsis pulmonis]|uniref:Uncharacterized protein n=1 Tax=Mycoplasmopsis pulmonis (strain UAB CTIP) TaxID=272635 RepID=Q98PU1_MYCPU|nr:hypothetical protein [Mycoplasmopsis pulmonis]CAC13801.1 unknown; predicted coding region [Mycoplasmopsis pulmonis]VEU68392.1 Uncharacterised protein [Mycoplasmopsis pulmonis]
MKLKKLYIFLAISLPLVTLAIALPIVLINQKKSIVFANKENDLIHFKKNNNLTNDEKKSLVSFVQNIKQEGEENNFFFPTKTKNNFSNIELLNSYLIASKFLLEKEEINTFLNKISINFESMSSIFQLSYYLSVYFIKNSNNIDWKKITKFLDIFYDEKNKVFHEKNDQIEINKKDIFYNNVLIWEAFINSNLEIPSKYKITDFIQKYILENLEKTNDENDLWYYWIIINSLKKKIY